MAPVEAVKGGFLPLAGPENPRHVDVLLGTQVEPPGPAPADRYQTQPQVAVPFAHLGIAHGGNLWIMGQFIHQGIDPQVSLVELQEKDALAVRGPLESPCQRELLFVQPIGLAIDDARAAIARQAPGLVPVQVQHVQIVGHYVGHFAAVGGKFHI